MAGLTRLLTLDAPALRRFGGTALDRGRVAAHRRAPFTLILGPNGAGKSVLLRLMHGLMSPRRRPHPLARQRHAGRRPWFSSVRSCSAAVLDNVTYGAAARGDAVGSGNERRRALEALARVGLSHLAARPARVLSGGEQQRVALARAWALRPRTALPRRTHCQPRPGGQRGSRAPDPRHRRRRLHAS
jgi:tungstate transport system ATP-binding protein